MSGLMADRLHGELCLVRWAPPGAPQASRRGRYRVWGVCRPGRIPTCATGSGRLLAVSKLDRGLHGDLTGSAVSELINSLDHQTAR